MIEIREFAGDSAPTILVGYDGAVYCALKTGNDDSYSSLSPGICLFYALVSDAFRTGLAYLDFLGEPARWKDEWATGYRARVNLALHPMGVRGFVKHLVHSRVRPLARKALQRE